MAVREGEDRRLDRGTEKLLTLEETARRLGVPSDDVEALIRKGTLTAFRLGGSLLRIRLKDLEALESRLPPQRSPMPASRWDRIFDFFHFNDFYLIAFLVVLILLALIFAL